MKRKSYSNKKDLTSRQFKFIEAVEGIGDILVFETKRRNRNKIVLEGLKRLEKIIINLFEIKERDPEKFEKFLLAQKFFDIHKENEKEAKLRLALDPDEYLITFSSAINQFLRIHEAALENKNDEISRFATYHLNYLLAELTKKPNNLFFAEQLLKVLSNVTRDSIKKQDVSMYAASIHWYFDIIFDKLRREEGKFELSYLDLLDRFFFSSIKFIISENQTNIFKSFVSTLIDGVPIGFYHKGKIWDYQSLLFDSDLDKYNELEQKYNLENKIRELDELENELDSLEKLKKWKNQFIEIKNAISPFFLTEDLKIKAKEIEEEIIKYVNTRLKYNNLIEMVSSVGAYCIFKQKYEFIKYLWEFKQPLDADATWIGTDILPNSLDDVVKLYFKEFKFERKFDFREDHHGSEIYNKKYFLLLLARVMKSIRGNNEGKYSQIENYTLPKFDVNLLSDIEHSIEDLIRVANDLKTKPEIFSTLGFDSAKLDELIDNKLIFFLTQLRQKAKEEINYIKRIKSISLFKVKEFKDQFIKSFNECAEIRNIFKYYKLYLDRTDKKCKIIQTKFATRVADDKAAFFDKWHVHYRNWGRSYGENLALSENSSLFKTITSRCKKIEEKDFENTIGNFNILSNIIILASHNLIYNFFNSLNYFRHSWHAEFKKLNISNFRGTLKIRRSHIPIFGISHNKDIDNTVAILNRSKLGKLIQYYPLIKTKSNELKSGIFYMNIQSLSENRELLEQLIIEAPDWLKKVGDKENQKEHLRERVLIDIHEKYEFKKHAEFEGYILRFK